MLPVLTLGSTFLYLLIRPEPFLPGLWAGTLLILFVLLARYAASGAALAYWEGALVVGMATVVNAVGRPHPWEAAWEASLVALLVTSVIAQLHARTYKTESLPMGVYWCLLLPGALLGQSNAGQSLSMIGWVIVGFMALGNLGAGRAALAVAAVCGGCPAFAVAFWLSLAVWQSRGGMTLFRLLFIFLIANAAQPHRPYQTLAIVLAVGVVTAALNRRFPHSAPEDQIELPKPPYEGPEIA